MENEEKIKVRYKNHRGEVDVREIIPIQIFFGSTEFHKEKQWVLRAFALDRGEERMFALKEIQEWYFD